jgi:CBS-domain-containing membrane protein
MHASLPKSDVVVPVPTSLRQSRPRLSLRGELVLAALPTATVLAMLALVHTLSAQPLLTASLGASAFLIYLDPEHVANRIEALIVSQLLALVLGWGTYALFGGGYLAAALALVGTIFGMVVMNLVHPPAIPTALVFALRTGNASNVVLFVVALGITLVLIALQRAATWIVARMERRVRSTPSTGT